MIEVKDTETGEVVLLTQAEARKTMLVKPKLLCTEAENMTKSEFAADLDPKKIIERMTKGQEIPQLSQKTPQFVDMTVLPNDYKEALDVNIRVNDAFMSMSPADRQKFHNDPQNWLKQVEADAVAKAAEEAAAKAASEAVTEPVATETPVEVAPTSTEAPAAS